MKKTATIPGREKMRRGGESQGGAYPRPGGARSDQEAENRTTGHGGQSKMAYHGTGQLGETDMEGEDNPNAPAK